jgi:putative flippase GtrA
MSLTIKYIAFAIIATVVNMFSQYIGYELYHGAYELYISMCFGTLAGLVIKYILDKKYIFKFQVSNVLEDGKRFILYLIMGIITTGIFWGIETFFDYLFQDISMRYVGGILGLSIGYVIKYQLDKRYVFVGYA